MDAAPSHPPDSTPPPHAPTTSAPNPAHPRRRLWRLLRVPLLLAVLLLGLRASGIVESLAFYHPKQRSFPTPAGFQDVSIPTPEGFTLHAWFIPGRGCSPQHPGPAVLFCHGNAGVLPQHREFFDSIPPAGVSVLVFDYRGFGKSQGGSWLSRDQLLRDSRAALATLLTLPAVDPKRVGLVGMSLGGVFASQLALEHPDIQSLALISAFSSWQGVASDVVPILSHILIPGGLDPADILASLQNRHILLIHGDTDTIVPYRHATLLLHAARAHNPSTELYTAQGRGHLNAATVDTPGGKHLADWLANQLHAGE